jgi:hypothetical protein
MIQEMRGKGGEVVIDDKMVENEINKETKNVIL